MKYLRKTLMKPILVLLAFSRVAFGGEMSPRVVSKERFSIIGIQARTNNKAEMGPDGKIGKLWDQMSEELFRRHGFFLGDLRYFH